MMFRSLHFSLETNADSKGMSELSSLLYVYVCEAFRWKIIYIYTKTSSVKYKDNYLFILMQAYININVLLPAPCGSLPPSHNSFTWILILFLSKYFIGYRVNDLD